MDCCWELAHWTPAVSVYLRENLFKRLKGAGEPDPAELRRGDARYFPLAQLLDRHLANRAYLVGEHLTLADISVAAFLGYADPAHVPLEDFAAIRAWYARLNAIPEWHRVQPSLATKPDVRN